MFSRCRNSRCRANINNSFNEGGAAYTNRWKHDKGWVRHILKFPPGTKALVRNSYKFTKHYTNDGDDIDNVYSGCMSITAWDYHLL